MKLTTDILVQLDNIASKLDESELDSIASRVLDSTQEDENARAEWLESTKNILDMVFLKKEERNFPWQGASAAVAPIMSQAIISATNRMYSELFRDKYPVKPAIFGQDDDGHKAVMAKIQQEHLSYELVGRTDSNFFRETYNSCFLYNALGTDAQYIYWDRILKKSCGETLLPAQWCINPEERDIKRAEFVIYEQLVGNNIQEKINSEEFIDYDWAQMKIDEANIDQATKAEMLAESYKFITRNIYLDLDDDNYAEPYLVTVDEEKEKVVRIKANYLLNKENSVYTEDGIFKKVKFLRPLNYLSIAINLPWKNSAVYGMGIGHLLLNPNGVANALLRQILDIGRLQARQGAYVDASAKLPGGHKEISMNELTKLSVPVGRTLHDIIRDYPRSEISPIMYQVLEYATSSGKELASVTEIMAGQVPDNTSPLVGMAAMQNSLVNFKTTYKLYLQAFSERIQLHALMYYLYMEDSYVRLLNGQGLMLKKEVYSPDNLMVVPTANPAIASDAERLQQQAYLEAIKDSPMVNDREVLLHGAEIMKIDKPERFIPPPEPNPPNPIEVEQIKANISYLANDMENKNKQLLLKTAEIHLKERELELKYEILRKELALEADKASATVVKDKTTAIKTIAEAEALEPERQLKRYQAELNALSKIKNQVNSDTDSENTSEVEDDVTRSITDTIREQSPGGNQEMDTQSAGLEGTPDNGIVNKIQRGIPKIVS